MSLRHPNRPSAYRRKRRACGLCKPHKRGLAPHFLDREKATRRSVG